MNNVNELVGKTLTDILQKGDSELEFITTDGSRYKMWHESDCCERVYLEDTCGDLQDLLGSPLLQAESSSNRNPIPGSADANNESFTWTFYRFATIKGAVTLRWLGSSNGYYSESVSFEKL